MDDKRLLMASSLFVMLLTLMHTASASSTQQYNKIFISPFYKDSITKNMNSTFSISLSPPDRIAEVVSAIVNLQLYATSSPQTIDLYMNGGRCSNPSFTATQSGFAVAGFDCSNVIKGEGTYNITISSAKDIGSIIGWLDITYMNDPLSSVVSIGGTEYRAGEPARVVLSILDNQGNPINNGSCFTTIRDSNDTVIINNESLNYVPGSNGIYFFQFVSEMPVGVYSVDSYCSLDGENVYASDTFHISQWAEDIRDIYNITSSAFIGFVGGTEYGKDETVHIRVQYLKSGTDGGTPVNNECCNFNLFSPNLTQIFSERPMSYISGSRGLYFYNWVSVDKGLGVYSIDVKCNQCSNPNSWRAYSGSTFHVWDFNSTFNATGVLPKLYAIQEEIASVNDTVKAGFNLTWSNQTRIYDFLLSMNSSMMFELGNMTMGVDSLRELVLSVNSTIVDKLYLMHDGIYHLNQSISSVNDTLKSVNATVMWKLYMIQDEIASVNMTVGNLSLNVTLPAEMNVTNTSIDSITDDVIVKMLMHARILNERIVNFHNSEYCISNSTLQHDITYNYCVGSNCRLMVDIMNETCPYGCDYERQQCSEPPYQRSLLIFGGVVGIILLAVFILRILGKI